MLYSTEHEVTTAHENMLKNNIFFAFKRSDILFVLLINVKMPTAVGI